MLLLINRDNLDMCWPARLPFLDDRALVQQQVSVASVNMPHDEVIVALVQRRSTAAAERCAARRRPQSYPSINCQSIGAGGGAAVNFGQSLIEYLSYDDA